MRRILVTGGAGFIGSNFLRHLAGRSPGDALVCLDALTYAGDRRNLDGLPVDFRHGDVRDPAAVRSAMRGATHVVHFAAETHVDRSIVSGREFLETNVLGTQVLLDAARDAGVEKFVQVSTDEVYGSVAPPRRSRETDALAPRNPYSASKAAGDLLALAHFHTHGLPVCVTRCGNNYGPRQFPEKLLPLAILRALRNEEIPVYGDGRNVRDWIFVLDHCEGIALVLEKGGPGGIYNIAGPGGCENLEILRALLRLLGRPESLLRFVPDRPGHDRRYALDGARLQSSGFEASTSLERGLEETVRWYRENEAWWRPLLERRERTRLHWLEEKR
jgi:dTDP-glucose 4,6-dehydratase